MGRPTDSSGPKKPCIRGGSRSHRKGQSYGLSPVVSNPDGHKSGRSYGSLCVVAMRPFGRLLWSLIFWLPDKCGEANYQSAVCDCGLVSRSAESRVARIDNGRL